MSLSTPARRERLASHAPISLVLVLLAACGEGRPIAPPNDFLPSTDGGTSDDAGVRTDGGLRIDGGHDTDGGESDNDGGEIRFDGGSSDTDGGGETNSDGGGETNSDAGADDGGARDAGSSDAGSHTGPCAACDPHATCTMESGHVVCECPEGYSGDGFSCTALPPCTVNNGGCDPHATCTERNGAVGCTCNEGYTGNGRTCTTTVSCSTNNGGCDVNANCSIVSGARRCECRSGYTGDGLVCALNGTVEHSIGAQCVDSSGNDINNACANGLSCFTLPSIREVDNLCSVECTSDSDCGFTGSVQNTCQRGVCMRGCRPSDPTGCFRDGWVCYPDYVYSGKPACELDCRQRTGQWCVYGKHCDGATGACITTACSAQSPCPTGQLCWEGPTPHACVDDCRTASTCSNSTYCDQSSGFCRPRSVVQEYESCADETTMCADGLACIGTRSGSFCLRRCYNDNNNCAGTDVCALGNTTNDYCTKQCFNATACPANWICPVLIFNCQP